MPRTKLTTLESAMRLIPTGATVAIDGAGGGLVEPDLLMQGLADRFRATGSPRNLTLVHCAGIGDKADRGLSVLAEEGLIGCVIGSHVAQAARMEELARTGKVEAYVLPMGMIAQLFREIAGGRPGVLTHVGLGTFVDPRIKGPGMNARSDRQLIEVVELKGREWLFLPSFPIDVALIRGTTADEDGNISMEDEAAYLTGLSMAQAARNSGGKVIAQVKYATANGSLNPKLVKVPGHLVDAVVVHEGQWQTYDREYFPGYSGQTRVPQAQVAPMPQDPRKVVARRAALEVAPDMLVNLGVGMADGIAGVLMEEGLLDEVTFTIEQGVIGSMPLRGILFGAGLNPRSFVDMPYQFDFYDGGGIDLACLGFLEVDPQGNVNSSSFGERLNGVGGFVDISQNAKNLVFCGTFTAGAFAADATGGRLQITQEGKHRKFRHQVQEISFSGVRARERGQRVMLVTERAVFRWDAEGVTLTEIAPGVDLERDVLAHMDFRPRIAPDLKEMDPRIFRDEPLDLKAIWHQQGGAADGH